MPDSASTESASLCMAVTWSSDKDRLRCERVYATGDNSPRAGRRRRWPRTVPAAGGGSGCVPARGVMTASPCRRGQGHRARARMTRAGPFHPDRYGWSALGPLGGGVTVDHRQRQRLADGVAIAARGDEADTLAVLPHRLEPAGVGRPRRRSRSVTITCAGPSPSRSASAASRAYEIALCPRRFQRSMPVWPGVYPWVNSADQMPKDFSSRRLSSALKPTSRRPKSAPASSRILRSPICSAALQWIS